MAPLLSAMKLKAKIFLLAIVPFLAAIAAIGIGVRQEATALAKAQHAADEAAYMASKEIELKHYVELATSAIAPLYDAGGDNAARRRDAAQPRARRAAENGFRQATATSSSTTCTAAR